MSLKPKLTVVTNGREVEVPMPHAFNRAHGTGLDGREVGSLWYAEVKGHPDLFAFKDAAGNVTTGTVHELFALLQHIAPDYKITAEKLF